MLRLESYVEARLGEDLSLASLAREVGISRSHFSRSFRQTLGQPPFAWLRAKRIERAKQLLLEGALSVAEVAIATGFADQAHLTRAFGQIVGVPPGAWQRTRRQGRA
jgi:transcriptional regulator GlxA family with amidase domain